jgi:hypothetical protein
MGVTLTFMLKNVPRDPRLERYLDLCQRIYERMERDGTWPWKQQSTPEDSTLSESLIDSDSQSPDL